MPKKTGGRKVEVQAAPLTPDSADLEELASMDLMSDASGGDKVVAPLVSRAAPATFDVEGDDLCAHKQSAVACDS